MAGSSSDVDYEDRLHIDQTVILNDGVPNFHIVIDGKYAEVGRQTAFRSCQIRILFQSPPESQQRSRRVNLAEVALLERGLPFILKRFRVNDVVPAAFTVW